MHRLKPPTTLETVVSSLPAAASLAALAAYAATPLAALLPVLGQTLAAGRHQKRIKEALSEISSTLEAHSERLSEISDDQFKLLNETILSLLQTTNEDKLDLLKRAIRNELSTEVRSLEASFLSRVLRDISAPEAQFLTRAFAYERVLIASTPVEHKAPTLQVTPDSADGQAAIGLLQLGLLIPAEPTWSDDGLLRFSPFVAKFMTLVRAS